MRVVDPGSSETERLAIVRFDRTYAHRFGGPNDEVWSGHPLHGKGLSAYDAHLVNPSPWIAAERTVNRVHHKFHEARWTGLHHYLLLFHDETFECLATGHTVEVVDATFAHALAEVARRVVERV